MAENLKIAYSTSWKSKKMSWKRKLRKSGSFSLKLVYRFICRKILAESANTRRSYVIDRTDDVNSGGSDTERPRCFWIEVILPRHGITAVNNDGMIFKKNDCALNHWWYVSKVSVNRASTIFV